MIQGNGKLLTAEQTVRLAALENVERERVIAAIAAGLREAAMNGKKGGGCPFSLYSRPG